MTIARPDYFAEVTDGTTGTGCRLPPLLPHSAAGNALCAPLDQPRGHGPGTWPWRQVEPLRGRVRGPALRPPHRGGRDAASGSRSGDIRRGTRRPGVCSELVDVPTIREGAQTVKDDLAQANSATSAVMSRAAAHGPRPVLGAYGDWPDSCSLCRPATLWGCPELGWGRPIPSVGHYLPRSPNSSAYPEKSRPRYPNCSVTVRTRAREAWRIGLVCGGSVAVYCLLSGLYPLRIVVVATYWPTVGVAILDSGGDSTVLADDPR